MLITGSLGILAKNETKKIINQEDIAAVLSTELSHEGVNNQMENYINTLEKKYIDRLVENMNLNTI